MRVTDKIGMGHPIFLSQSYSFNRMKLHGFWVHSGFWVILTIVFTIIEASYKGEYEDAFVFQLIHLPIRLLVVYFNYFFLLPKFLFSGKVAKFFLYTILSLVVAGFVQRIINYYVLTLLNPDLPNIGLWLPYKFLQASVLLASPLIFFIGASVLWKVSELQKKAKTLENEKLQSELKYLKSQINPHFLFNTLNNIYGLSLENSTKTPGLILKLSDFLSFSLYESDKKLIPIEKEIQLLNDFIALEKARFEDRVHLDTVIEKKAEYVRIPPLILVPFVENAFKHGLTNEMGVANIHISLSYSEERLHFTVINSKPAELISSHNKGIGLDNIRKRLDIMYENKYDLSINNEQTTFEISLTVDLT